MQIKKLTEHGGNGVQVTEPKVFLVELVQMMASGGGVHAWNGGTTDPGRRMGELQRARHTPKGQKRLCLWWRKAGGPVSDDRKGGLLFCHCQ